MFELIQYASAYRVRAKAAELATGTRGIKFVNKGNAPAVAEFAESNQEMTTSYK